MKKIHIFADANQVVELGDIDFMITSGQAVQGTNAYQPGANGGIKDVGADKLQSAETDSRHFDAIVLNIPHSSVEGLIESGWPKTREMWELVRKWTDWYTDYLFETDDPRVKSVRMGLSRFIVDAERLIDDPLQQRGEGIVYSRFGEMMRSVNSREHMLLMQIFNSHQQMLRQSLTPNSLLIDCHSFPSELSDVDVCIGYNDDWSHPSEDVIGLLKEKFQDCGYNVGINTPYSNSITPVCDFEYQSVMLELNKRIYMDETTLQLKPEADAIQYILRSIYALLLE